MIAYQPVRLGPVRVRPAYRLGAEELIELGRSRIPVVDFPRRLGQPNTGLPSPQTVTISADEAKLMLNVVDDIVSFSQSHAVEFQSYCPPDRWQAALENVGTWNHEIQRQVNTGAAQIVLPADIIFRLMDLEKCVTYARDASLTGAQISFGISAAASVAGLIFGVTWLATVGYVGALAVVLGRPLIAKFHPDPQAPYAPAILSGKTCELIAMKLKEEEKKEPNARKVLERVLVSHDLPIQRHYWGTVKPRASSRPGSVCLAKERFRVRVEGWSDDEVEPTNGWARCPDDDCWGSINISVYDVSTSPGRVERSRFNQDSGHEKSYWVEYSGPLTQGRTRRSGPFGCTGDPVQQAMEDGGFSEPGVDGRYVILDKNGAVVESAP